MKSKVEQLFILVVASIGILGLLCLSGCGETSCEGIKCGNACEDEVKAVGISLPGCGGCLSSEKGCDSMCYSQSIKIFTGIIQEGEEIQESEDESGEESEVIRSFMLGCDNRYYGDGCLGCAQTEKSCYSGIYAQDIKNMAVFYGSTDGEEKFCGVSNGCGGCYASDGEGKETITIFEQGLEID